MAQIRERKHRLNRELYVGQSLVAFTLCIQHRARIFIQEDVVKEFEKVLLAEAANFHCDVLVYLFMPDHCHILIEGKSEQADALKFINRYKQKTGYWLSKHRPHVHWQKDYYDHILRNDKDVKSQIWYILANPVRKQIVTHWKEYKFKGSTVFNFDEW